ncbi:conserved hypothetical protein [Talaromyces stipitatus ATCC 10500]|uniref:Phosphatidylcholine-sterol O-acyltransferase n=1 Tax=Talaromyces stipitatus (strain ATCC 10500 / CBS 375.48 / QM 6759 / NRRL 1006) TaxID=441959 RepID=B8MAD9_TALSN|nr:uncharacterized protein TSTA_123700 [Talaromyces stipitatus ATCC 10500]EED18641.1 conserved hypothetical protein [Talaromyces stipitatus ATCC 10500]
MDIQADMTPPESGSEQPKLSSDSNSDVCSSDEIDEPDADDEDQVNDVLGVSISQVQSRMKARQTPAEEKSRAIESSGGYFDMIPDEPSEQDQRQIFEEPESIDGPTTQSDEKKKTEKNGNKNNRHSFTRSMLMSSLSGRRRASSGDSGYGINLRKLLPDFSLSPSRQSSSSSKLGSTDLTIRSRSSSTPQGGRDTDTRNNPATKSSSTIQSNTDDGLAALGALQNSRTHSYQQYPIAKKRPPLSVRQSMSDESLYVRSLSRVSTLEHRPHYENVHSQVNSRYKAIKDSLQDSSSRIFSMPSFNLPDFRHEWHPGRFLGDYQRKDSVGESTATPEVNSGETSVNGKPTTRSNTTYPLLDQAAFQITGDVVVMGGYRGSILRSAKPPHRQLWVPMKVGLNIRKVDLEVGLSHEDEERMEKTIIAREVLSHIGPVDICRRLLQRLSKFQKSRNGDIRVWDYGYDWRLSPHLLSKRLIKFLEGLPCNAPGVPVEKRGAYVIAHSLGGLITRHAVNQRPDLFAGVVYAGTPQHCVNILGPLRNGDEVLLSSKVLTAQVNFTIRTSYALLPDDGRCFINRDTKEDYLIDFFDVKSWDEYSLSPCIRAPLPPAGNDNKKSLTTLPRIGLGKKRLSVKLGKSNSVSSHPHGPRASREKDQRENVPGGSENEEIPIDSKTSGSTGGTTGDILGPNTSKAPQEINTNQATTSGSSIPSNMNTGGNIAAATSTIPREQALEYLDRTLKEVKQFRQELTFDESHQQENRYPPFAVLYSKALPTVYGARVSSREDIKRSDAYDDLAFAAGDGVCLASAAMLPKGYRVIKHGLVRSDRGHVGLLGDLEGVGQCLLALARGREAGVGLGVTK